MEAGRFIHNPNVIAFAWQLVKEYNEHQHREAQKKYGSHKVSGDRRNIMGLLVKKGDEDQNKRA